MSKQTRLEAGQSFSNGYYSFIMVIWLIAISLIPFWVAHQQGVYLRDDVYITLTYSKNLAAGHGFVFNHPPPVQGTTTPLWAALIAVIHNFIPSLKIPLLAGYLSAFFWAGILWLLFLFRKVWQLSEWKALILGTVMAFSGWGSFLGMESYLFAFLLTLTFSLFYLKYYFGAGVVSGLLFCTRGEGVLIFLVLAVLWYRQTIFGQSFKWLQFKPFIKLAVGAGCIVLPWLAYAWMTFGDIFPNTLYAKIAQGTLDRAPSFFKVLRTKWLLIWAKEQMPWRLGPLLALVGLGAVAMTYRRWLGILLWIGLYIIGYSLLGVRAYDWYKLPIDFGLDILTGFGIVWITVTLLHYGIKGKLAGAFTALLILAGIGTAHLDSLKKPPLEEKTESYTALGQWFADNTQPSESIAFAEIGYLGFYTHNKIIDLAGLVLPQAIEHIEQQDLGWPIWHYKPDYVVYLPEFDWSLAPIINNPEFIRAYLPIQQLQGPFKGEFTIYKRRGREIDNSSH